MARERTKTVTCAEAGCRATTFYTYTNQRQYAEITRDQQRLPFKCSRHREPDQVLRPDNPERQHVLVARRVPFRSSRPGSRQWLDGLYWLEEGQESGGSGLALGPGFKAHASDFPEGTRLVVTAHVELPDAED